MSSGFVNDLRDQSPTAVYQSGVERTLQLTAKVEAFSRRYWQFIDLGSDPGTAINLATRSGGVPGAMTAPDGV